MDKDFRKKTFRGAKIEDHIIEVERLANLCEQKIKETENTDRQRFYEGMAIAYTTIVLKLKGEFEYIEPKVIDELYSSANKVDFKGGSEAADYTETCSFCKKEKDEVGTLVLGPGVSICPSCLEFGKEVLVDQSQS
ncbi:ClpX C4-type zinc finger protein [Bacillus horti]|uniref:ClpX-type ZB domain-containing protein n=1 Tax=Caldalkalibacillus horti TaxID=77523 RepID=A0ABT9VX09_9BACI|nr:ClpX C4-type zinc finger protein [Bacillus horti]MDQ0165533.1 hypothetical protein [Bacillus horti]